MASPFEVYLLLLNNGLVNGGIFMLLHQEMLQKHKSTRRIECSRDLYNSISPANKPGGSDQGSGELGALTLAPGVYKSASGTKITNGDLTLDAQGNENATWYFNQHLH
jgi:hypothetical protein